MAGLMLEITSSNWNLNCISDNLLSPNQNKQKHHTYCLGQQVHSNTIRPLQRAIYLILEWREVGGGGGWTYFRIHDRGLDASYMEANGDQNVDLNSQLGTIVATHPHLQLKQNSIPSPPQSLNFVVHPCLSFARFCESRISSYSS